MDPTTYLVELQAALQEYRFRDVRALTNKIDPSAFELPQIKKSLGLIRRKRLFAELEHARQPFLHGGKICANHSSSVESVAHRPEPGSSGIEDSRVNV